MSRIPDEDIEKVREATDIVDLIGQGVVLKQKGGVFWGCCPFHGEKTASFKVDPLTGLYYCFGCHKHGNVFDYVMETDSLSFREAVISLAQRAHIPLNLDETTKESQGSTARLRDLCDEAAKFYQSFLLGSSSNEASEARSYLASRSLNIEVAKRWGLGFAPGHGLLVAHLLSKGFSQDEMVKANVALSGSRGLVDRFFGRIMFPISDTSGRVIAFGGRIIGKGEPKYLNSSDTPLFHKSKNLFGLDKSRAKILDTKTVIVVEGYTDVIALHESGFSNAVATLGTALTAQHVKLLSRFAHRIIYIFDGDEAGMRAASRAVEFIDKTITIETNSNPMILDVVVLPDGQDPAEITSKEDGKDIFERCLSQAVPLIQFSIDRKLEQWDLSRSEERQRALNDATAILVPLRGTVMASDYAQYIVDKLWAHGVRIEVASVMKALETQALSPRQSFSSSQEEPSLDEDEQNSTLFNLGSLATADERLAQEALLYMLRDKESRQYFSENLTGEEFCFEVYQAIFNLLKSELKAYDMQALIGVLSEKFPGFDSLVASHQELFNERESIDKATHEIAQRLKEHLLEKNISVLTERMRDASLSVDDKQRIVMEITQAQKALLQIRASRHQL